MLLVHRGHSSPTVCRDLQTSHRTHRLTLYECCQQLQRQRRAGQRQRRRPRLAAGVRQWRVTATTVADNALCAFFVGICVAGVGAESADQVAGEAGRQVPPLDQRVEGRALAAARQLLSQRQEAGQLALLVLHTWVMASAVGTSSGRSGFRCCGAESVHAAYRCCCDSGRRKVGRVSDKRALRSLPAAASSACRSRAVA